MRISRFQMICGAAILLVALSAVSRPQDQQTQKSPSQEERMKAIKLVKSVNVAEIMYSVGSSKDASDAHGRFASWTELYNSGLLNSLQLSQGPEVIPGYHLDVLASPDGKSFLVALHDVRDGDGLFSVFSDQTGIIFLGAPPQ